MELYDGVAATFRGLWRILDLRVRSEGSRHVPRRGPAVLASNHIGYLDFCFVALAAPAPRRRVRFLVRDDVFDRPLVGAALRRLGQVPLDVHGDPRPGLERARTLLAQGEVLGVHPEGTISPSFVPRQGRTGAVRLAQETGAPVVPVGVWGSQRLLTKWRPRSLQRGIAIEVVYGEPWLPPRDQHPVEATAELMARIRLAVQRAQQRYPQTPDDGDDWWVPAHLGGSAPTPEEAERRLAIQIEQRRARAAQQDRDGRSGTGRSQRERRP